MSQRFNLENFISEQDFESFINLLPSLIRNFDKEEFIKFCNCAPNDRLLDIRQKLGDLVISGFNLPTGFTLKKRTGRSSRVNIAGDIILLAHCFMDKTEAKLKQLDEIFTITLNFSSYKELCHKMLNSSSTNVSDTNDINA